MRARRAHSPSTQPEKRRRVRRPAKDKTRVTWRGSGTPWRRHDGDGRQRASPGAGERQRPGAAGHTPGPDANRSLGRRGGLAARGGRGGTHLNNLLLLFLLRLFAAPGLSLFLGGHCGERWDRPDLRTDGCRGGIWHRRRRKTGPPSPPQRTESEPLIRRRVATFATGRGRRALWVAKSGGRRRSCARAAAESSREGAGTGRGKVVTRHVWCRLPPGPFLGRGPPKAESGRAGVLGGARLCLSAPFY